MVLDWRPLLDLVVASAITGAAIFLATYKQAKVYYYFNSSLLAVLCLTYTFYLIATGRFVDIVYALQRKMYRMRLLLRRAHWRLTNLRLPRIPYWAYGWMSLLIKVKLLVFSVLMMYVYLTSGKESDTLPYLVLSVTSFIYLGIVLNINPLLIKRHSVKLNACVLLIMISVFAGLQGYNVVAGIGLSLGMLFLGLFVKLALTDAPIFVVEAMPNPNTNGRPVGVDMRPVWQPLRQRIINKLYRKLFD